MLNKHVCENSRMGNKFWKENRTIPSSGAHTDLSRNRNIPEANAEQAAVPDLLASVLTVSYDQDTVFYNTPDSSTLMKCLYFVKSLKVVNPN